MPVLLSREQFVNKTNIKNKLKYFFFFNHLTLMPIVFLLDYKTAGLYFLVIEFENRTPLLSEIPSLNKKSHQVITRCEVSI
tara:strand:+ start:261 stop:503 length:243 start_codon:yes stop_codon:yes gene_type:complete